MLGCCCKLSLASIIFFSYWSSGLFTCTDHVPFDSRATSLSSFGSTFSASPFRDFGKATLLYSFDAMVVLLYDGRGIKQNVQEFTLALDHRFIIEEEKDLGFIETIKESIVL